MRSLVRQRPAPLFMLLVIMLVVLIRGRQILVFTVTNIANTAFTHLIMQDSAGAMPATCNAAMLESWPISLLRWSLAIDTVQPVTAFLALGRWAIHAGCRDEAILWFSQAHSSPLAAYELGQLHEAAGHIPEAVQAYQRIPAVAVAWVEAGHMAASDKNWALARYRFEFAVRIAPENPFTHYALGEDLLYNPPQDLARGISELQVAAQMGYPNAYVYARIAHGYAMSGRYPQALEVLESTQQDNALANAVRGDAYLALHAPARAIIAYQDSLRQEPNNAWVNTNLGQAYWESGDHERAIQAWQRALEISPGFAPALGGLQKVEQP